MPITQDQHLQLLKAARTYQIAHAQLLKRIEFIVASTQANGDYKYAVTELGMIVEHNKQFRSAEISEAFNVITVERFRYNAQRQKENDYQKQRKRIQRQRHAEERILQGLDPPIPRNTSRPIISQDPEVDLPHETPRYRETPVEDFSEYEGELTPEAAKALEDPEMQKILGIQPKKPSPETE